MEFPYLDDWYDKPEMMGPFMENPSELLLRRDHKHHLAFNTLLSSLKGQKVFVHCRTGSRVVGLMMIYNALEEGMSTDKAEQEAKKAGALHPQVLELANQVIGRHRK